jgi:hypothetical protein
MTMHGADALFIQKDSMGAGFKVANATGPVGAITDDRLAGIHGMADLAAIPETVSATSTATVPDGPSRTGTTHISLEQAVPDLSAFTMLSIQDRAFDAIGEGSALVSWAVRGKREDGTPFRFIRRDRFANQWDISFEPVFELYDQLWTLQNNGIEEIELSAVRTNSAMGRELAMYNIDKVMMRSNGAWRPLRRKQTLELRAGTTKKFRVGLVSSELGPRNVVVEVPVPRRAAGKRGFLQIVGGNEIYGGGGGEGMQSSNESFDQLLRRLARAPRNDHVVAQLFFFDREGSRIARQDRTLTDGVVNGGLGVRVRGIR